jgi:surfeit locus 1 family protein
VRRIGLFGLTVLVGLAAIALGAWQLGRLAGRKEGNALARAGLALPTLPPDSAIRAYRRIELVGTLDHAREFILRNRLVAGVPAVQVVTPLIAADRDTAVLVNRGYVPAADAVDPGEAGFAEPGVVRLSGVLLPIPNRGDGDPITHRGKESWHGLDLEAMRARLPYPVAPVYLVAQVDTGDAHTVRGRVYPFRAELPPMDEGPHLMYAVQWFGIAAAVLAFGVVFILRGGTGKTIDQGG